MLRRAIIAWSLDTERSIMIGDRASDVEAGQALGMRTALVTPGGLLDAVETAILDAPAPGAAGLTAALQSAAQHWRGWLFETALPLWLDVGFDRENGCFHERLSLDGQPVSMPRRIRVQARQLYVYARAGQLGWTGPWEQAVEAALEVLLTKGLRADGGTRYALDECGAPSDNRRDLYDLAFVLLGFAQAIMVRPGDHRPVAAARALTGWLDQNWAHPQGGYYEGDIVSADVRRQNPHMHLFEAFLALFEATGDNLYRQRALDMAHLGRDRMFQSAGGAIPEYFETDWRPSTGDAGVVIEPGHQFEWSYLFNRLDGLVGGGWQDVAEVLRVTGEVYGVDPATGMVFEEVLLDGRPKTGSSRLWTHAERIKAHLARMRRGPDAAAALAVLQGQAALMDFCNAAGSALWLERRDEAGRYVGQDVLASSFYHIMGAAEDLIADRAGGAR